MARTTAPHSQSKKRPSRVETEPFVCNAIYGRALVVRSYATSVPRSAQHKVDANKIAYVRSSFIGIFAKFRKRLTHKSTTFAFA